MVIFHCSVLVIFHYSPFRFTNARRRIIQPMLDAGKSEDAVSKLAKYATHNIPRPWTVFSSQATRQEAIQRIPLAPKSGGRMSNSYSEYQSSTYGQG